MSIEEEIREVVDQAKAPGTFKIVDVLKERAYPTSQVTVHIDEESAYRAAAIKDELSRIDSARSKSKSASSEKEAGLLEKLEEQTELLKKSAYTFYLRGISEGKRDELFRRVKVKYPIEYDQQIDIVSGGMKKVEKDSPERDSLFTDLLWEHHIQKIVDPDGNEQVGVSYTEVKEMRQNMPVAAIARINEAIEKMRISSAVFMMEVDEDFLAKS
jgi:hypothetical protein